MSGFSTVWLAMREGADTKARCTAPARALNRWLGDTASVNIIDLGCGTGANLRWLAPRLDVVQRWHLFDNDARLLKQAKHSLCDWARSEPPSSDAGDPMLRLSGQLSAHIGECDLSTRLPPLDDVQVLGASALLDLVSRPWLSALVAQCARQQIGMLFALNYDGRMNFSPSHPDDAMIRDAMNRDQHCDKGFGAALGPDCAAAMSAECATHGYRVGQWRSDWLIDEGDHANEHSGANNRDNRHAGSCSAAALHARLINDFAQVALRNTPSHERHRIRSWQRWRQENLSSSRLRVGHVDLLALPADRPSFRPSKPPPGQSPPKQ